MQAMKESAAREESVPVAVQLLRTACVTLDNDSAAAKRDIRRALELLLDSVVGPSPDRPILGLAAWQARRVVEHVLSNLETPLKVQDLATVVRLSTSHFSRAFRLSFHVSPHAYIVAVRLAHARALMLDSDEPMSQIAVACGFADQAHFTRVFRRRVGCAPGLWRRERRNLLDDVPVARIRAADPIPPSAFRHMAMTDDIAA
jgi:AraC-like DNA-binding protein